GGGVVTVHGVDQLVEEVLHDGDRFLLGGFGVRSRSGVVVRIAWSGGCHIGPGGTGLREAVRVGPGSARSGSAALSSSSPVRTSTRTTMPAMRMTPAGRGRRLNSSHVKISYAVFRL